MRERGRKIHVCSRGKRQRLETGGLGADKRGKESQLSRNGRQEYSRREEEQRTDTVYSELEQM